MPSGSLIFSLPIYELLFVIKNENLLRLFTRICGSKGITFLDPPTPFKKRAKVFLNYSVACNIVHYLAFLFQSPHA